MTANVANRQVIREAFATLLSSALVGPGKPAQKVYEYKVSDFKGKYSIVVVTSGRSNRSKQAQVTRVNSLVNLEVHSFVLYAGTPTVATNNPSAGSNVNIFMPSTEDFLVGDVVTVEDLSNSERPTITAINPNVSITVNSLTNSFTTPSVFWWTEKDADNRLDWLEKAIADVVMDNDTNETWAELFFDGPTELDPVRISGKDYLHEVVPLQFRLFSE